MTDVSASGLRLLVVGASSGIGRAIAEAAVAGGDWVAVGARRRDQLEEIKGCHACITADVRDPADCDRLASEAAAQLGGLDALVYAPAFLPLARLVDTEAATWHAVLETSVVGAALVTRAALPWLVLSKGRAAYLSSPSVGRPRPGLVAYIAGKAALDAMIAGWRNEITDMTFTRVVLGPTFTGISTGWDPKLAEEMFGVWQAGGYGQYESMMTAEQVAAEVLAVLHSPIAIEDVTLYARRSTKWA